MTQSAKGFKSDSITTVIADTISNISTSISNVASNVSTLTTSVATVQTTITTIATPKISSISYVGDDTAADPAGGQTITLNGLNFVTGATVLINNQAVSVVSVVDSETITFTSPALAAGSYIVYVINTDGGTGIAIPGIQYSGTPAWSTAAGTLGTVYETAPVSQTLSATGDAPVTYSLVSGTLPPGSALNANGTISGTSQATSSSTTYTFTIKASDAQYQDTDRQFSITVNPDVVSWVSPSSGATITLDGAYSSALSATDAAGYSVSYTANSLPTGLTLSSGTISGTASAEGTTTTLLTATAATTNRTATNTITWVVALGDIYWKNVSLLLSGSTPTPTFINDASLNNSQLTIQGDTKPNNFNPYSGNYYSNYFDGTGDAINAGTNAAFAFGTGQFCIEAWIFNNVLKNYSCLVTTRPDNGSYADAYHIGWDSVGGVSLYVNTTSSPGGAAGTIKTGVWQHFVCCRDSSNVTSIFVDGVRVGTATITANFTRSLLGIGDMPTTQAEGINGYISNLRLVKGYSVYDPTLTSLTVPTGPLQTIPGTSILSCQYNRFMDNSLNQNTLTRIGNVTVSPAHPFATPTTISYNTQYSTYFDGTGDYLQIGSTSSLDLSTGDFTIEAWVYLTASKSYTNIISSGNAAWGTGAAKLNIQTLTPSLSLNSNGTTMQGPSIVLNTWNHIAVTRTGTTLRLFTNGIAGTTYTASDAINLNYNSNTKIGGGDWDTTNSYFTGNISNLRVIKGTALYTSNFTPSTTPLTAVSGTSLLTCQDSTLKDNSTNNFTITSYGDAKPVTVSPFTMTTSNTTVTSLGSAYFSASSAYSTYVPQNSDTFSTGDFTVECWLYPTVTAVNISMASSVTSTWELLTYSNQLYWHENGGNLGGAGYGSIPLNAWSHLAVSRSGTTLKMFINGIQVYTVSNSFNYSASPATRSIGPYNGGSTPYYLSDFRVVKGTALYTANFLPPQTPLTPVTNTQLLTCQYNGGANNNGFVDQSNFNNVITRNGNVTQGTFSPYSQTGWSNYFNGSSYLTIPNNTAFDFSTSDFTIECWINPTTFAAGGGGTSDNNYVASALPSTGSITGWYFGYGTTGGVFMGAWVAGTNQSTYTIDTVLTVGRWSHVAFTRTSGVNKIFIDGVSKTLGGTFTQAVNTGGNALHLGAMLYSTYYNYPTASISNFRIVKGTSLYSSDFTPSTTPLTPVPNTSLLTCQSNRVVDNSVNNFTLTKTGDGSVQAFSPFGGVTSIQTFSNYFDGTGDYLSIPNNSAFNFGTGDFTIEWWQYLNSAFGTQNGMEMGQKFDDASSGWVIYRNTSTNTTKYTVRAGSMGDFSSVATPSNNVWEHWALVRSSGTLTWYVNGVATGSYAGVTVNLTDSTGTMFVGRAQTWTTSQGAGYYSNVRVVKGTALYTANFTPSTTPLTAITGTSLLTCQSNRLSDSSVNNFTVTKNGEVVPKLFNPFGLVSTTRSTYTPAIHGGSGYFDGTGDVLTNTTSDVSCTGDFTLEAWIYKLSNTAVDWFGFGSEATNRVSIGIDTSNNLFFNQYGFANVQLSATIPNNTWIHIALVRVGTALTTYVNGAIISTVTTAISFGNAGGFSMGSGLNGYLSDVRLFKGLAYYTSTFLPPASPLTSPVVTPARVLMNFINGGIIDYHGTNDLETVGNTQLASEDPYSGSYYSNYFDGSGYLLVPASANLALSGDYTIECWVYFNAQAQQGIYSSIDNSGDTWQGPHLEMYSNYAPRLVCYTSGGSAVVDLVHQTAMTAGTWNHIAVVRASNATYIYLNGVRSSTTSSDATSYAQSGSIIGSSYPGSLPMTGYVSNFRVIKGTAIYSGATFTVPTTPLTAISGTQLLTCQNNKFIDNSTNAFTVTSTSAAVKSRNPFQQNTGKSLYFNGTTNALLFPGSSVPSGAGSAFTFEVWIYPTTLSFVLLRCNGNASSLGIYTNASGQLILSNTFVADFLTATGGAVTLNVWNYVTITRTTANLYTVYLNGTSVGSATYATSLGEQPMYIGYNTYNGAYSSFYIKDLRITKYARYTATFTPPTTPMQIK